MSAFPWRGSSGNAAGVRRHRLRLTLGAVSLACWVSGPATASAIDGVAPGTGGEGRVGPSPVNATPSNFTGTGGQGGGQGGSLGINRVRNDSVNGTGGQGYGTGPGAITTQGGTVGRLIATDTAIAAPLSGGNGQDGPDAGFLRFHGTSGAGGGAGMFATAPVAVEVTVAGSVTGGKGGAGGTGQPGSTNSAKGGGGGGGNGITLSAGGLITNIGTIAGGAGGRGAGTSDVSARAAGGGGGGHAVEGANLTLINRGILTGGAGGASGGFPAQAGEDGAAVRWRGGTNLLRLQSGSIINGALWVGTGATATLSAEAAVAPMTSWLLLDGNAAIDTAADLSFGGPVTGVGRLTKTGAAVLSLSGVNSFSGGLTISGGEVQGTAQALGTGAIRNDALLRIDAAADAALQQNLTGTGRWVKQGSAGLTLGGATTLEGRLDIAQGRLAMGATGTLATAALALTGADSVLDLSATAGAAMIGGLDGVAGSTIRTGATALVTGDATDHVFAGSLAGPGALEKRGTGTLTLVGTNTHAGGTTISAGTLAGSAASFGSGAIVDNALLRIAPSADADWGNAVSGLGRVEKRGAGTLTLQQTIDVAGGLSVLDGRIAVTRQTLLGGGPVTVGGQGQIALALSADTSLRHIGGDGLVAVDLGDANHLLTMSAAPAGATAFTGTLTLANASLALAGPGTEALSAAALRVDAGGRLLADAGTGSIGALRMNGGAIRFMPLTADNATSLQPLLINRSLDLSGPGTVQVLLDLHGAQAADSMGSLMARDDGVSILLARSAPGGQVIGTAAGLALVGGDGRPVGNTTDGEVVQEGQRVAVTSTRYGLSAGAGQDGLHLTARLLGVDVLAGHELRLSAPPDAIGMARDLSVVIGGAGSILVDAGNGRAISFSGSNTYAGGTRLVSGTLTGSASSFGSGAFVDNAVLRIDQSTDADWVNAVTGAGRVEKTGAGTLTPRQAIDAAGGLSVLDGRIAVTQQTLLGGGPVTVGGQGQIALTLSADTLLRHIGGDGFVAVDLGDTKHLLTMSAAPAGAAAFTGTLALANAGLALAGAGTGSLSTATLRVDVGGRLLVDADTGPIGALRMNAGAIRFTPLTADNATTLKPLMINRSLDLSGTGTVQVQLDLHGARAADSMGPLMTRDDGLSVLLARTAPGAQVSGTAAAIGLVGIDGQPVGNATDGEVVQGGQRVAVTSTRYGLSTGAAGDGLHLTARLLGVDVLAGRELVLAAAADADGMARDLSAPIVGAGTVAIDAGNGKTLSLSSVSNTYAGGTRLVTGTLTLAGGSLPDAGVVTFQGKGTGVELGAAGRPQRLGGLDGLEASSRLELGAGTLTLDTAADHAFAGAIAGSGALVKTGPGTQTLAGANTYGGGTTINAGTLVGSASSFGRGDIRNDAALVLDVAADVTLPNTLTGSGTLYKQGAGTLTLEGPQSTGSVSVRTGGLIVGAANDGSALLRGKVDIAAGAWLQGNGTIDGNARLSRDATLQLRSAAAALRVQGDLQLDPGTRLNVSLEATSRQPGLIVGGKATVDGALLHVDAKDGDWKPNERVDLLRSAGVLGRFAAVETNLAFLTPTPETTSQGVALVMRRNQVSFVDLARTPNQKEVAGSLVSHEETAPASDLLVKLPRNEVGVALQDLSGGLQAGAVNAPTLVAAQQRGALNRQLRTAPGTTTPPDRRLWATVHESRGMLSGDAVDTLDGTTDGVLFGIDLLSTQDSRLGVAIGADRQTVRSNGDDRAALRSGSFALYGALAWRGVNLRGALSYAQSRILTSRVVVAGMTVASLKASERARHAEGFLEVGLPGRLPFGQIEPFFQLGRFVTWAEGFRERGDDATALTGAKARDGRPFGMAGLHGSTDTGVALGASWSLQATAAVQHVGGPATVTRRVNLPGADSFVTSAPSGAGTGMLTDLGLTVRPRPGMTLAVHAAHGETGGSRENSVRVQGVWQY